MPAPMYTLHASDYDKAITNNIFNAHLERPSTLAMLPELEGKKILDLGCGPGAYIEHYLNQGASVTAIDKFPEMIDIVKYKFGEKVTSYAADLSLGLPEEFENTYDLVVCPLMIHYIDDLTCFLNDVKRVLKADGAFYFSTHHPMVDFESSPSGNYFSRELVTEEWDTIGKPVQVQFYRRPLSEIFATIANAGLYVSSLSEGAPSEDMKTISPEHYERLSRNPNFIFMECKPLV